MLRDQVHRVKKKRTTPVVRDSRRTRSLYSVLLIIAGVALVLATLWYGLNQVFSYLLLPATPRVTLFVQTARRAEMGNQSVWLLVENQQTPPRFVPLATQTELTTGMTPGLTVAALAVVLNKTESPQMASLLASQSLGLAVDRVVLVDSTAADWRAVVRQLRQEATTAVRAGTVTDDLLRLWLVARMAEGESEAQEAASVITFISRQNLEPISSQENCPVAVLNNTGKAGFASLVGKIVEQNGGTVLRVANALTVGESVTASASSSAVSLHPDENENCRGTLAAITKLIPNPAVNENRVLAEQYRSSLVLLLGPDVYQPVSAPATEDVPNLRQ